MAVTRGCKGKIFAKANGATGAATQVKEVRSWSFEETAERIDASEMGDCTKKFESGAKTTSGTIAVQWDPATGSNQAVLTVGDKVDIELYPGGNGSGSTYYKGTATIESVSRSGEIDGIVASSYGFAVDGEMTTTGVP